MFGINSINGSIEWLGVPNFSKTNGPPWTANILDPQPGWGDQSSSTDPNWDNCSGGIPKVFFPCGIFPCTSFQFSIGGSLKKCAVLHVLSMTNYFERIICTAYKVPPLAATPSTVVWLTNGMTTWRTSGMSRLINNLCGKFPLVVSVSVTFSSFLL